MTINDLVDNFEMSRPAVSKHIKLLHAAGFISIEESGRERYCTLKQDGFNELQDWMSYFDQFWTDKMKNLESLLNAKDKNSKRGQLSKNKKSL
jgi:DNA-binding transcriptional ArsR family regulator